MHTHTPTRAHTRTNARIPAHSRTPFSQTCGRQYLRSTKLESCAKNKRKAAFSRRSKLQRIPSRTLWLRRSPLPSFFQMQMNRQPPAGRLSRQSLKDCRGMATLFVAKDHFICFSHSIENSKTHLILNWTFPAKLNKQRTITWEV